MRRHSVMVARLPIRDFTLKAGRAGSIPDDVAKIREATQPLRYFLNEVGEAVANLNTTVVGLDAVENGHQKPSGLNISWNPHDRCVAARKARRFVLEAVLVRVSEALSQYINTISKLSQFTEIRGKWEKDSKKSSDISNATKLEDLSEKAIGKDCYLTVGACLLIHWRNRFVHPNSKAKITGRQVTTFRQSADEIEKEFSSLSVDRLMRDFDEGKPTLKGITSIIAMAIRLARKLDAKFNDVSHEDLRALLMHYGLDEKIRKIDMETSPSKRNESVLRLLETTAPGLVEPFREFEVVKSVN